MQMQIPSMMGHSIKKCSFWKCSLIGTGKVKIKSNKKEIKFDSINTFQSPCLAINLPLSSDLMPSAVSGIPLKRVWGIYWGVPWRVMDEGRSLPVQLNEHSDFLELLYVLQCPLLTLPFPSHDLHRIPEFLFLVNSWIPCGTSSVQWRWIHGMQMLCLAIKHLISLGMSRAPVSLYPSEKTLKVIGVNWDDFWTSLCSLPSVSFVGMKVCSLGCTWSSRCSPCWCHVGL